MLLNKRLQRRFYEHEIKDEADFVRHMDYLHYNPVKHGLVERVINWPYSSFHHYVKQGFYLADWGDGLKIFTENFSDRLE